MLDRVVMLQIEAFKAVAAQHGRVPLECGFHNCMWQIHAQHENSHRSLAGARFLDNAVHRS